MEPEDRLSPASRRGFAVGIWVWIPSLVVIGLVIWLVVRELG